MFFRWHKLYVLYVLFRIRVPTGSSTTAFVLETGSVAAEVFQVPNQPIQFRVLSHLELSDIYKIRMFVYFFLCKKADPLKKIDLKMQLSDGCGKHLLKQMVVIHLFFPVCL